MSEQTINILLIEDDEDDFVLLKKTLAKVPKSSYNMTWLHDTKKATEYFSDNTVHIFLVDYRLGETTGLEIIKQAQKSGCTKPFILLTGVGNEDLGIEALRSGADDYLIKSGLTPSLLERAIRYAIERREIFTRQQELIAEQKARIEGEKERKRLYKMLMESPAMICILTGSDGVIELYNNTFNIFWGDDDVVGKPMRKAWPELELGFFDTVTHVYTTGEIIYSNEFHTRIDRKHTGEKTDAYVNFVYQPVREANGEISGVMVHGIDVTDQVLARNRVQESEARLRRIVDSNMVGIMFYDPSGLIFDANDAFLEILGYSRVELMQHKLTWQRISPKEFDSSDKKARKEIQKNGVCNPYEKEFIHKNGTRVPVYIGAARFESNADTGVAFVLDITERKKLERQKDEFIGVATHELKTPVTSIKAYTQILQQRFLKEGNTRSSEMLSKMDAQLNKLISLISDLLDVTKIEGGKLSLLKEEFDMNELVGELVEELQRTTMKHTISIIGKINHPIIADRDRTGQVITNLISNAIKYSPHSNKIEVELTSLDAHAQLSVRDFGVGIPKEKQEKVFERFYRVSGPKEDTFPGLGLGLYISSEIIKRQGGKIWVESTEKVGSTFRFTLPFVPPSRKKKE